MYNIISLINFLFSAYYLVLLARVIISWVRPDPYNPLVKLIYQLTEPVLGPIRRVLPPLAGLDFSPLVAYFALEFLHRFVIKLLLQMF